MSFSKRPGENTPQWYTKPLDSLKNWNNRFFWVDERVFPTVVDWRTSAPKDRMPAENTYSSEAVRILDTHRTPIQKQPEALLCLVGLSRIYYLGDEVASNPTKVKTESRPHATHEVPMLTMTAPRVIEVEDLAAATDSSGVPSTIERSPLDFANEAGPEDQETMAPEVPLPEDVPTTRVAAVTPSPPADQVYVVLPQKIVIVQVRRYMLLGDPTMDAKDVFSDSGPPVAAVPWEDLYYEEKWDM
nr:hypothetical protein [Tanacetum cinerariifolium]